MRERSKLFDLEDQQASLLRDWDPARGRVLDPRTANAMRRDLLVEGERGRTRARWAPLALAAVAGLLVLAIGVALTRGPTAPDARAGLDATIAAPSGRTERTNSALQLRLTGESGTRIYWTLERRGDG